MRLIYDDEALDAIDNRIRQIGYEDFVLVLSIRQAVRGVKPVDAVPVVHGHWERGLDKDGDWISVCSVCGEVALYDKADDAYLHTVFCPWCGARMDGDDNDKT